MTHRDIDLFTDERGEWVGGGMSWTERQMLKQEGREDVGMVEVVAVRKGAKQVTM